MYTYRCVYIYISAYICEDMYKIYICTYLCVYIYIYRQTDKQIDTYIHTKIHMYIHTYIHTYIDRQIDRWIDKNSIKTLKTLVLNKYIRVEMLLSKLQQIFICMGYDYDSI